MDLPNQTSQPASHLEYVIEIDRQEAQKIKANALHCMDQLEGWCSHEKALTLIDLVLKTRPKTVVEIGVWGGKSLVPMAVAIKACSRGKIYGIDPWDNQASIQGIMNETSRDYWEKVDHDGILKDLLSKVVKFDLQNQIELIKSTSADALPIQNIDILHIDGNHSEGPSYFDVTKWVPLVRKGGWIIFDDMTWYENGVYTTGRAVEWLNTHCIKVAEFNDSCVWGIWVKK